MPLFVKARSFLRNLFSFRRVEVDLDEEIRSQLEMLAEEKIAAGMTAEEAQRAARIELGGIEQVKEQVREERIGHWLQSVLADCRYSVRQLSRNPGFTTLAMVTLALGIGTTTSVFSLINAVLLRSLPYGEPERLVYLFSPNPRFQLPIEYLTPMNADFFDIRKQNHSLASLALFGPAKFNVASDVRAEVLGGARVTGEFFNTMGVPPEFGRTVDDRDDQPGREQVAVISHHLWNTQFGAAPDILSKTLLLDAKPYRIIGVMPTGFGFPHAADAMDAAKVSDIWIPWAMTPEQKANRNDGEGNAIGRLRQDVSLEQAQAEVSALMATIDSVRPMKDRGFGALLMPLVPSVTGGSRKELLLLMGAVVFLLLIACSNVASLVMARAEGRLYEMSVRVALGASRSRLIRQLLTESFLLAAGGGVLGCYMAFASIRLLMCLNPGNIPRLEETSLDTTVLFFALGVSALTGLLFGLFPALSASRCHPSAGLNSSGSRSVKGMRSRFRSGLIVSQVALTLVLLVGSGLFIRSLQKVYSVDKGFESHSTLTMHLSLDARYLQPERQIAFYHGLIDKLTALPGVQAVGAITNLPLAHGETLSWLTVEGHSFDDKIFFQTRSITPQYLSAMGIRLLEGRGFGDDDVANRPLVAIVNRSFAETYFPDQEVLGRRLHFMDGSAKPNWYTVVGVVADVRHSSLEESPKLQAYISFWQGSTPDTSIVIRTTVSPEFLSSAVRKEVNVMDSAVAVGDLYTMDQLISEATAGRRFQTLLLSVFAGTALLVALIGLYALLASSVQRRTAELGIRMALGAQPGVLVVSVLGSGMKLVLFGLGIGLVTSLALSRFVASFVYGVRAADPATFFGVTLLFLFVTAIACWIPARRATRVDPMVALRYE
jgi:predicted permease